MMTTLLAKLVCTTISPKFAESEPDCGLGKNIGSSMYGPREFADAGGLMAYGPNLADAWTRAATYVDGFSRGSSRVNYPVEQPTKFELVINLKTAKALGLTIPPSLLRRAEEVIR